MIEAFVGALVERLPLDQRERVRRRLRRIRRPAWLGTLRRNAPFSSSWGFDRGTPIDRYYIERFLGQHRPDIRGAVLEVKDPTYTDRFGSAVASRDVLDIRTDNPAATIVADLAAADSVPAGRFDCFILTQTLQLIHCVRDAVAHAHRMLGPGGVLLVTVPCISRIVPRYGLDQDHWRFTPASCQRLFGDVFGREQIQVETHGNALAAIAFLAGMAAEELSARELDERDPYFPVIVTVRAVRPHSDRAAMERARS